MYSTIKKNEYEIATNHTISSLSNLSHTYFHVDDKDKINGICFGLHQENRPPTLIYPRPKISVKRIKNGKEIIECEQYDDSMNVVLASIDFNEIFKALFNYENRFEIDLTNQENL